MKKLKSWLPQLLGLIAPLGFAAELADLIDSVAPSVVNIQSIQGASKNARGAVALGTGFVVGVEASQRAYVLTNSHVIASATEIEVLTTLSTERFLAKVVGQDASNDIAVLEVTLPRAIKPLTLGSSQKLRVGERVFAIGNPFGLGHTVTDGILSARDRSLGIGRIDQYLQTNTAINFGNSGGPLFNMKGEVVGMNTLVKTDAQGIGFAIPSDVIVKVVPALKSGSAPKRAYLGVALVPPSRAWSQVVGTKVELLQASAPLVARVQKGSPADKLGLKSGDQIVEIKIKDSFAPVQGVYELKDWISKHSASDTVEFKIRRASKSWLAKVSFVGRAATEYQLASYGAELMTPEGLDFD
jgi:serine protease Do